MRALVFHHPKKVSLDTVDDPKLEEEGGPMPKSGFKTGTTSISY